MISNFGELHDVIRSGWETVDWHEHGQVNVQEHKGLLLFSYMATCQFKKPEEWNWFEQVSRGLVIDAKTGEVVARPFDKFWNYGEVQPSGDIVEITEKVDGSLGIGFYHGGQWQICTRGSFESEQAVWATKFLRENYDLCGVQTEITLLFEIIYPDNRIVVDYGDREDLVLLGIRNTKGKADWWFTAVKHFANCYGFKTPPVYEVEDIDRLLEKAKTLGPEHEGWVVRYSDGTRVKIKGAAYLEIHKWVGKLSLKSVAKAFYEDKFEELIKTCPLRLQEEVGQLAREVMIRISTTLFILGIYNVNAPDTSRKEFALWAQTAPPKYRKYLFLQYDGKLTDKDLLKGEFGL